MERRQSEMCTGAAHSLLSIEASYQAIRTTVEYSCREGVDRRSQAEFCQCQVAFAIVEYLTRVRCAKRTDACSIIYKARGEEVGERISSTSSTSSAPPAVRAAAHMIAAVVRIALQLPDPAAVAAFFAIAAVAFAVAII